MTQEFKTFSWSSVPVSRENIFEYAKMARAPVNRKLEFQIDSPTFFSVVRQQNWATETTAAGFAMRLVIESQQDILSRISALEKTIAQLQEVIDDQIVEIRDVSDATAKKEVSTFFGQHHGEILYPSDVAEVLRLDYDQVKKAIEALNKEGKIAGVSS